VRTTAFSALSMSGHFDGIAGLTSPRRELTRLGFAEVCRDREERI
jgi:hypothetical protein